MTKKKAEAAPEPNQISVEVFSSYRTPSPVGGAFREAPRVWLDEVSVYRYRVTVERIEEPQEVVLARMIKLWGEANRNGRDQLAAEAILRFGVNLREMAEGAPLAAPDGRSR